MEMLTNSPTRCHHRPYGKSRSPELASHETKGGVKTEANTFAVFFDALMEATCLSVMACAYPRPTTRKPKTTRYLRPHRTNLLRALDKSLRLSDAGYTIGIECEWTYIYGLAFLRCCCGNEQLEGRCRYSAIASRKLIHCSRCQANTSKNMTRSL